MAGLCIHMIKELSEAGVQVCRPFHGSMHCNYRKMQSKDGSIKAVFSNNGKNISFPLPKFTTNDILPPDLTALNGIVEIVINQGTKKAPVVKNKALNRLK